MTATWSLSMSHESRRTPRLCTRFVWGSATPSRIKDGKQLDFEVPAPTATLLCQGSAETCCPHPDPYFLLILGFFLLQEARQLVKVLQDLDPPISIDGRAVDVNLATGKRR